MQQHRSLLWEALLAAWEGCETLPALLCQEAGCNTQPRSVSYSALLRKVSLRPSCCSWKCSCLYMVLIRQLSAVSGLNESMGMRHCLL